MLTMAAAKPAVDALTGVEHSTLVTARPPGGLELGLIQVGSGEGSCIPLAGAEGPFFPGYLIEAAVPDPGDAAATAHDPLTIGTLSAGLGEAVRAHSERSDIR
jgi:hypothetical protein